VTSQKRTSLLPSQPSIDSKTRQNQHQRIDTPPHKWNPSAHLKIPTLIHTTQQSTHNRASNQPFQRTHGGKQRRHNPYDFPIAPLDDARPQRDDQVDAADQQEGPVDGEAQDVAWVVEVEGLRGAWWEWPVQGGEDGGCVAQRGGAVEALDEAGGLSVGGQ
jgi:hypothetical protein